MGLLTDKNKNIEGFLDLCQSCVIGSQFLEEQTGQESHPSYVPRVFKIDLDEDTDFALNWLADEVRDRGQDFLGWPRILENTSTLSRLLDGVYHEMGRYVHDYFNYNALIWIKREAVPSAQRIADILLDEVCRRIAKAYNDHQMHDSYICSKDDGPTCMMNTGGYVTDEYFKEILGISHDYGVIENTFAGGWPADAKKGIAQVNFNINLRPDARLGALNPINLVSLIIKYPVELYGNLDEQQ